MANTSLNSSLNSNQLKEHYALCIQLCSTNKINTKNAFGLHIIDYMNQLTKNQKDGNLNFKLVSSTLDVGTKIYSNRVDSVNTQAQRVASNLHHALDDKRSAENAIEDDEENEENEDQQNKKKTKQRTHKKAKVIGTKESITLTQLEFTGEQDQLFLKLSSTVDVGAANSYLIETLDIDSTYTYRIDSNEPYYKQKTTNLINKPSSTVTSDQQPTTSQTEQSNKEIRQEFNDHHPTAVDFNDFYDKFSELSQNDTLRICPRLDKFNFNNLSDGFDYGQNSAYAFRNLSTMNDDNLLLNDDLNDINENSDDLGGYDDQDDSGDNFGDRPNEYTLANKSMINSDNVQFMLGIIGALSDNPTDYCLFDKKIALAWAGHDYWKPNPVYRMKMNQLAQDKTKQPNQQQKAKKTKKLFTELEFDNPPEEVLVKSSETTLKLATVGKWQSNKTLLLPEDFKREPADFVTRFTGDPYNVLVRHRQDDQENMNNTIFNDNDLDDLNNDDYDDNNSLAGTEFNLDDFDYATQETEQHHTGPMPFIGDNLVDQPQIIPTINLPYTKFAKKIDVKRLKGAIWDLIKTTDNEFTQFNETKKSLQASTLNCDMNGEINGETNGEMNGEMDIDDETMTDEDINQDDKYIRFSTIYQQLPRKVNPLLAKNLSVPITLVTLLHVVNEKNLKVEGQSDLKDFSVIAHE